MAGESTENEFGLSGWQSFLIGAAGIYSDIRVAELNLSAERQRASREALESEQLVGAVPMDGRYEMYQPQAPVFFGMNQVQAVMLFGGVLVLGLVLRAAR